MNSNLQVICGIVFKRTFPPSLEFQARDLALAPCVGASCHGGRLECPIRVGLLLARSGLTPSPPSQLGSLTWGQ